MLRLRVMNQGKRRYYSLGVPPAIGEQLEKADSINFICELTQDGVLFRPAPEMPAPDPPAWAQKK